MEAVSFMGTVYMLLLTILVLIGGVNFRRGFLVLNILGWGALFIIGAKEYVDYPRPLAVDSTLNSFGREQVHEDISHLQPTNFFEVFSEEMLQKTRSSDIGRYGFPSGHVAIITGVWLGIAFMFRKPWLCVVSISMVLLTILSRLYLGVHYLGDTIGGLALGLILAFGFNILYTWLDLLDKLVVSTKQTLFLLSPLLLLFLYASLPAFQAGALIGFNLGLLFILKVWSEPTLSTGIGKKAANTLLFVTLYFAMYFFTKQFHFNEIGLFSLLIFTLTHFVVLITSFLIAKRLGFMQLKQPI